MIDPYNNQRMTFSEIVHLLSSHMVPADEQNPQHTIPLLEKFVNRTGANFDEIDIEMQQRMEQEEHMMNFGNHQEYTDRDYNNPLMDSDHMYAHE